MIHTVRSPRQRTKSVQVSQMGRHRQGHHPRLLVAPSHRHRLPVRQRARPEAQRRWG